MVEAEIGMGHEVEAYGDLGRGGLSMRWFEGRVGGAGRCLIEVPCREGVGGAKELVKVVGPKVVPDEAEYCDPYVCLARGGGGDTRQANAAAGRPASLGETEAGEHPTGAAGRPNSGEGRRGSGNTFAACGNEFLLRAATKQLDGGKGHRGGRGPAYPDPVPLHDRDSSIRLRATGRRRDQLGWQGDQRLAGDGGRLW